jgi:hypothetical protein
MYTAQELWTWGFPVEVGFLCWLRLWKSIGRAAQQPLPKGLVQARSRVRTGCRWAFERTRDRDVRVKLRAPHEDVETLDLFDQEHDRAAGCCNLCAWIFL